MKIKLMLKMVAIILIFIVVAHVQRPPAEELSVPSAVGFDIQGMESNKVYKISMSSYIFQEGKKTLKNVYTGIDYSTGQTRQKRQLQLDKNYITGIEKTIVISEKLSRTGIRNILNTVFNDITKNDTSIMAVCDGEAKDILELNMPGYATAGDYIEQMIENSKTYNFFEDSYKTIDVFVKADSEGRNVKLPYIKNTKEGLVIEGLALFKKDKMVEKINMQDARTLNMLSDDAGKGIIALQKKSDVYTDYYAKVKRNIKCMKKNEKYIFDIKLNFSGDLSTNNEYNSKAQDNFDEKKKLEKEFETKIQKKCKEFISKMQKVYKIDCLELGRVAASKYGRDTGTDWDEAISNSEINVKVSVRIVRQGRGEY